MGTHPDDRVERRRAADPQPRHLELLALLARRLVEDARQRGREGRHHREHDLAGRIHTDRVDELDAANAKAQGKSVDDIATAARAAIPAGRYGTVEEFADTVCFLAS